MVAILDFLSYLEGASPWLFNIASWALIILVLVLYHRLIGKYTYGRLGGLWATRCARR